MRHALSFAWQTLGLLIAATVGVSAQTLGAPLSKGTDEVAVYRQQCAGGQMITCRILGTMYEDGRGGLQRNEREAVRLHPQACDGGHMFGCVNLAVMYERGRGDLQMDLQFAMRLYHHGCDGDEKRGCQRVEAGKYPDTS